MTPTRRLVLLAGLGCILAFATGCPPKKRMVLAPANQTVSVDDTFDLAVETRAYSGNEAFSFVLDYDPALLALDGPVELLHAAGLLSIVPTQVPGKVVVQAAQTTGLPNSVGQGEFLAIVSFRALAPGVAAITFDSGLTGWTQAPTSGSIVVEARTFDPAKSGATVTIQ